MSRKHILVKALDLKEEERINRISKRENIRLLPDFSQQHSMPKDRKKRSRKV